MPSTHVSITKLDHLGCVRAQYAGQAVFRDEEKVAVRCPWTSPQVYDLGPLLLEPGDVFIEYYYQQRWFNIMAIYDLAGVLKGWYCNLTEPAHIQENEINWRDLALDLLVMPDGEMHTLDEHEFGALPISEHARKQVEQALATLREWVRTGHPPFPQRKLDRSHSHP